ncbi:MAG: DUF3526 domain-containing protein [Hyphomonas sp.]
MSSSSSFPRETWFLLKDRAALIWLVLAFLLSTFAVVGGVTEVNSQRQTIERLLEADRADRAAEIAEQSDWGGAAYYAFHLTYDPPSELAFAALGQRETASWKHRVRMLALEGQIHEADPLNPEVALIGRIDFAFVAAFLAPLLVVLMMYDLKTGERAAGRFELLSATAQGRGVPWRARAGVRLLYLALSLLLPFWAGGLIEGAGAVALLAASAGVILHLVVWTFIAVFAGSRVATPTTVLTILMGLWLVMAVLIPAFSRTLIERAVPVPSGAEIMMAQREAVNNGWDLPREVTMEAFLARHPEWRDYSRVEAGFEWKWYYAFQQVGDQTAEPLSQAYTDGRLARDRAASVASILSPPVLLERTFQTLARTDVPAVLAYEQSVRDFHAELRAFHYPGLFRGEAFTPEAGMMAPSYEPVMKGR